jgi:uncharacterized protein (UPF0332 family)
MAFDSYGLLDVAKSLIEQECPPESHCARSISTIYYALFQHICCSASENIIGGADQYLTRAKSHLMRSISHNAILKRLTNAQNPNYGFPIEVVDFCNIFCSLQKMRHDADYNKFREFTKEEVEFEEARARCAMEDYDGLARKHKKAFLVWAIIEKPRWA